jgi:YHS domain-containing protein
VKDPERYLKEQSIEIPCVVHPRSRARLDPAHRAFVNYEIFYFSTPYSRTAFLRNPLPYCGWLTDPVSGVRFRPNASSPRMLLRGRPYYFASESTRTAFKAMPDSFAVRKGV